MEEETGRYLHIKAHTRTKEYREIQAHPGQCPWLKPESRAWLARGMGPWGPVGTRYKTLRGSRRHPLTLWSWSVPLRCGWNGAGLPASENPKARKSIHRPQGRSDVENTWEIPSQVALVGCQPRKGHIPSAHFMPEQVYSR